MDRVFSDRGYDSQPGQGPVVTISREFGCPSKLIAQLLTKELNQYHNPANPQQWKFINKEIVEAMARQLDLNPTEVNYMMSLGGYGLVEDVLASFSQSYVSNHRIRKTITSVVRSIAGQGYVVIVGRGGSGILQDFPNTIHIRLQATLEWRTKAICKSRNLSKAESSKLVVEMDNKRDAFVEMLTVGSFQPYFFNIALNCSSLSNEEIVGTILGLMKIKKLI